MMNIIPSARMQPYLVKVGKRRFAKVKLVD